MINPVLIEGYTPDEILNLPQEQVSLHLFAGQPLVFRAGSAEILGEFRIHATRLVVQLAHVDGGGEGAMPTLWLLVEQYARKHGFAEVEWIVYATDCARPNCKLQRLLERRRFVVQNGAYGRAYYHLHLFANDLVEAPTGGSVWMGAWERNTEDKHSHTHTQVLHPSHLP